MVKRSFTIKYKLEAVAFAEKFKNNEAAARKFNVDGKRIREWIAMKDKLRQLASEGHGSDQRKHLKGQGPQVTSESLESMLIEWIEESRHQGNRVSRKMIQRKAREHFQNVDDSKRATFFASNGWLDKFLERNGYTQRRVTSVAQRLPSMYSEKIVNFISYTAQLRTNHGIPDDQIIAMDETPIYFDMPSKTTIDKVGVNTVTVHSTGHEKAHATVVLAAKGDGKKLKPFIVFKQAIREVKSLQDMKGVKIVSSKNGWMDNDKTCEWLSSVVGKLNFGRRLLVWDSYRCHISEKTKTTLRDYNMSTAVIPGGCTKYIQAPDVSWNKPLKDRIKEMYDAWLAGDDDKEYTSGGNLKAPSKRLVVNWVLAAWNGLSTEMIRQSFKSVGLTVAADGSEDGEIHCLKPNQPCRDAWDLLVNTRLQLQEVEREIVLVEEEDEEELAENEIVIYND